MFPYQDRKGRQFVAMHDVREALVTAAASLTTGTQTSFLAGDTDYFLDMIECTLANNSNASATIALVNDGTTIRQFEVPAASTIHIKYDAPLPQQTKNTPWNIDMNDITGTTVTAGAIFIKKS